MGMVEWVENGGFGNDELDIVLESGWVRYCMGVCLRGVWGVFGA